MIEPLTTLLCESQPLDGFFFSKIPNGWKKVAREIYLAMTMLIVFCSEKYEDRVVGDTKLGVLLQL